jgi:hypothetical protein
LILTAYLKTPRINYKKLLNEFLSLSFQHPEESIEIKHLVPLKPSDEGHKIEHKKTFDSVART